MIISKLVMKLAVFAVFWLIAAGTAAAADKYGAISVSPATLALGWSYNVNSRRGAERLARANCRRHARDCRTALWFRNACGAIAIGRGGGWGAHWGRTHAEAERNALLLCSRRTTNCVVRRWACTDR